MEKKQEEYTILSLIRELNSVVDAHGDLPLYIFDEFDVTHGKNELVGFAIMSKEKDFPYRSKRIEFF